MQPLNAVKMLIQIQFTYGYLLLFVLQPHLEFFYIFPTCVKVFIFLWTQKLPKVNKELALKLMEEGDEEAGLAARKKKGKVGEHWLHVEPPKTTKIHNTLYHL